MTTTTYGGDCEFSLPMDSRVYCSLNQNYCDKKSKNVCELYSFYNGDPREFFAEIQNFELEVTN
ncbi:MAG: hypothetical protein ACI83O_000468 [Patescibacteria group bacterium]|jgi:hypothetical protein